MRTGRVKLVAEQVKTIIYVPSGNAIRFYRVFNAGSDLVPRAAITISGADNQGNITLEHTESIDFGVKVNDIIVTAGAEAAEVVYEFLG